MIQCVSGWLGVPVRLFVASRVELLMTYNRLCLRFSSIGGGKLSPTAVESTSQKVWRPLKRSLRMLVPCRLTTIRLVVTVIMVIAEWRVWVEAVVNVRLEISLLSAESYSVVREQTRTLRPVEFRG